MQVLSLDRRSSLIFFICYGIITARGEMTMLVLPIVNRNRVMHVKVSLKDANKIHNSVILEGAKESDVIVNQHNFLESSYLNDKEDSSVVNFIRNTSLTSQNDFLVTTREEVESNRYDVYQVKQPPKFVNRALDGLYASVITDMRKEIPNMNKGRYLSFEKLGFDNYLTDDAIARLQEIIKTEPNRARWPELFRQAGISDIPQTFEFLNHFDCTIISDTTLPEDSIQGVLKSMEFLNTQDYRNLKKYYNMAQSNQKIYSRLATAYYLIYQQPYKLIMSEKQKAKIAGVPYDHVRQKVKLPYEIGMEGNDYGKQTVLPN